MINIDINADSGEWVENFNLRCENKDLIILFENDDEAVWFCSNMIQKICVLGRSEVVPIYGKLVNNIADFTAQINLSLPCAYRMGPRPEVIYDTLLNFETEPDNRTLIWCDSDYLFKNNLDEFKTIFETMVVAGYLNRNKMSSFKEDDQKYHVNQRNIFVFVNTEISMINFLLEKEYTTLSLDVPHEELTFQPNFEVIRVPASASF